jgi:hypothetical protein
MTILAAVDPEYREQPEGDRTQRPADLLDLEGDALISAANSRHRVISD